MSCIGTAGHVDHGKSTLVKVLTGIDPDRLAEEKERGMTIDLGFAWLTLPSGREVSIVDVPGHESFIKNMLAGVGGIDAALLVVAADEGIMPQTREHLAILDLLRVPRGVVALTKADLVDEEWLELVREEIEEQLKPTSLAGSPILPVSAYTGEGLPTLLTELDRILDAAQDRQNITRPRLPIDRVFSLTGFGTVVTGTLLDGNFKIGQEVEILPQGMKTRIRGLQTHRQQVEMAQPGNRVAINVAGIARSELARGNIVALPGQLRTTMLFDARISLLADAERPLSHNTHVDVYSGSQEVSARVRLLDTEELQPGQSAWAQLRLNQPVVVARRDRFIVRIPSPSVTIGGGEVVDVHPRYHRRFQSPVLDALENLSHGSPEELVLAALDRRRVSSPARATNTKTPVYGLMGYELADIVKLCNLAEDVTQKALETLVLESRVRKIAVGGERTIERKTSRDGSVGSVGSAGSAGSTSDLWFAQHVWENLVEEATRLVGEHHRQYPLRSGLSKEEWRNRLGLSPKIANEVFNTFQSEGLLEIVSMQQIPFLSGGASTGTTTGGLIRVPGFIPTFTPAQQQQVERLLQEFWANPYTPPGRAEAEAMVGAEVLTALVEQGRLVKIGDSIVFLRETYDEALTRLVSYIREHGKMTAAEARDVLGATRKYILPLLEHMDALRLTRRIGDERVLGLAALRQETQS